MSRGRPTSNPYICPNCNYDNTPEDPHLGGKKGKKQMKEPPQVKNLVDDGCYCKNCGYLLPLKGCQ